MECVEAVPVESSYRQTGRTSVQIQMAPKDAYYLAHKGDAARSFKKMAEEKLGRTDLKFMSIHVFLTNDPWRGCAPSQIVVDHATWDLLRGDEIRKLLEVQTYMNEYAGRPW